MTATDRNRLYTRWEPGTGKAFTKRSVLPKAMEWALPIRDLLAATPDNPEPAWRYIRDVAKCEGVLANRLICWLKTGTGVVPPVEVRWAAEALGWSFTEIALDFTRFA